MAASAAGSVVVSVSEAGAAAPMAGVSVLSRTENDHPGGAIGFPARAR